MIAFSKNEIQKPSAGACNSLWYETPSLIVLAAAIALLFASAPIRADMWWSDAPRHAMDGAFFRDFFRTLPVGHPRRFATNYYLQYPALTILFYPPLFAVVESVFFELFGVSLFSAQLTVAVFYLAAAWGAYFLSRRWLGRFAALAVSIIFVGAPEVALWGRQVMLEVPATAFLIWSAVVFFRYLDEGKSKWAYLTVLLLAGGVYTKQTIVFILPVFALVLWIAKGRQVLEDRQLWGAAAILGVLVLPLGVLSLVFGKANANSIVGGSWTDPVFSWKSWLYYPEQLPSQTNWVVVALAAFTLVYSAFRKGWFGQAETLFASWIAAGYLFFSLIAMKEARHTVLILLPLAFLAVQCVVRLLPSRAAIAALSVLAGLTFANTLLRAQVPEVQGYKQAANFVAERAPRRSAVMFSGARDGAFIFDMRARGDRRDLMILRADKFLFRVAVRRERGIEETAITETEMAKLLNRYGVRYVVNEPNFWNDLKNMQMFQELLHSNQFRLAAVIPVSSNVSHPDQQIEIYENLNPVSVNGAERIRLELPIVGLSIEGAVGDRPEE